MPLSLTSAIEAGWRALRRRPPAATLAQVVSDNFNGMVVVDAAGTIVAASRIASDLLNGGAPLEGRAIKPALPQEMRRAIENVLTGVTPSTELALAVIRQGPGEDDRLVLQYAVTASDVDTGRVACLNFWDVTERRRAEERLSFLA
jgi:hypothetical protein